MQRDAQFGAFRIVRRLGVGGMAETFIAERRGPAGFEQRVCLKRVLPAFCEDEAFVAMFQNEARLAARLSHPHIAQVYDFGEVDSQWWMTLELIDGIDLRALLDAVRKLGQPMPLDLTLLIFADVCAALAYAHEPSRDGRPGIVHRDVSPSNVLLSYDGAVKLADFGIAKPASGDRATASGVKGKVPYMSPEQALGGAVDGRSDLFSLGVMAYEMLAERRPFDGPTDLATLANLVAGTRPKLADLAPHAPPALVTLIERLIAPSRDARPASASDVLDALSSTSPPLSSRRVLGQLVRRLRPPDAAPAPVDPTGPTVPTPSPPGATARATVEPARVIEPAKITLPARLVGAPPQLAGAHAAPDTTPSAHTATVPETPAATLAATPVAFTAPSQSVATPAQSSSRALIFAVGSVALLLALTVSVGVSLLGAGGATPLVYAPPSAAIDAAVFVIATPPLVADAATTALEAYVDAGATVAAEATATDAGTTAPSVAEAQNARGTLAVTAYPWGFVEVDGRELGRSPVRIELTAGEHNVLVRADGIVKRRRVTVAAGRTRELVVPVE